MIPKKHEKLIESITETTYIPREPGKTHKSFNNFIIKFIISMKPEMDLYIQRNIDIIKQLESITFIYGVSFKYEENKKITILNGQCPYQVINIKEWDMRKGQKGYKIKQHWIDEWKERKVKQ